LNFLNAKNLASQSISFNYELITFIRLFSLLIFIDMEKSVMPLIQRKTILKDFKNHKLKYK
jgi:hypothetical protein